MLSRLIRPPLQLRSILTLTLVSSSTKHSSLTSTTAPHLPPIGPNSSFPPRSSRSFSIPRGGGGGGDEGGGSWRFTPETDEADSIFVEEEGSLSGITEERAAAVESGTSSGSTPPSGDLWSDVEPKGDIFGAIDREVGAMKAADEEWETAEGYKPWSLGEDEDKKDVFSIGEEGGLGIEGIEELETKGDEEKKQLEEKEKQLMTAMKGPNRAFGDLIAASGITEDMIDSLILLKDARGVKGLPPLHEIEDKAIARMNETSTRGEIERKKQEEIAKSRVRKVDEKGRAYGTGRRKCSIARVWIQPGDGKFIVNEKQFDAYFTLLDHRAALLKPFTETKTLGLWDVDCTVKGGGVSGQVGAVRLGISRALQNWEPGLRPYLKAAGYLTRDPRVVERKKPGKAKARKSFQWVKR